MGTRLASSYSITDGGNSSYEHLNFSIDASATLVETASTKVITTLADFRSNQVNEEGTGLGGIEFGWSNDSAIISSTASNTSINIGAGSAGGAGSNLSSSIADNYTSISDLFVFNDLNDYINRLNYSAFANLSGYYDGGVIGGLNLTGTVNASCVSINQTTSGNGVVSVGGECSVNEDEKSDVNNWWALILVIVPCLTLFGNVLVILAVFRERTLQTVTNYFIVSLALADLLVAVVVMPFAVYVLVSIFYFHHFYLKK